MSLPTDTTTTTDGSLPVTASDQNTIVIDSALSEWVYHRADQDQGLALTDILSGTNVRVLGIVVMGWTTPAPRRRSAP